MSSCRIVNVRKHFGSLTVLKGVHLDVASGELVCLLGPSGGGKSTLLRCINGLTMPDAGYVTVGGEIIGRKVAKGRLHDLKDHVVSRQRRRIGMVFQSFNLFPHLTAIENLMLTPVTLKLGDTELLRARAEQLLDRVGLSDRPDFYPNELSGGQQQRIAIARALMMEPTLMLFDEPTSALDPHLTGEVLETMRDLAKGGMTMIVVTHELSFAREVADRVVLMSDGRIVEDARPDEFFTNPRSPQARQFLRREVTSA